MTRVERLKKMVSPATHKQLNKVLFELDHVTSPRAVAKAKTKVRNLVEKLFSFKDTFKLHDDFIIELAEILEGLYPEKDNLEDYVYHIRIYLNKRLSDYKSASNRAYEELTIAAKNKERDPDTYMDKKYVMWTYSTGYYAGQACAYRLLRQTLDDIVIYAKTGFKVKKQCKRKKSHHT